MWSDYLCIHTCVCVWICPAVESHNSWAWKAPLGTICSKPWSKRAGRTVCSGLHPVGFWTRLHKLSRQSAPVFNHGTVKCCCAYTEFPIFLFMPIVSLWCHLVPPLRRVWPIFLTPPVRYLHTLIRSPAPSLLQAESSQLCQPLLVWQMIQSLNYPYGLLQDLFQYIHVSIGLGSPALDTALGCVSPGLSSEKCRLPWPAGDTVPNAAQEAAGHLCRNSISLAHVSLPVFYHLRTHWGCFCPHYSGHWLRD